MGQYFYLFNRTRDEYVSPPSLLKAIERMTSPKNGAVITYLLLDGPLDGTGSLLRTVASRLYEQNDFSDRAAVYELTYELRRDDFESDEAFHDFFEKEWPRYFEADEDDYLSPRRYAAVLASHLQLSEATEYGGRWAGDEIAYVGDYATDEWGAEYARRDDYHDITDAVVGEINWLTDGWLDSDDQSPVMAPDMVFTAKPDSDE